MDEFLTKFDLGKKLKCSSVTIDRLRKKGLPWHKLGGQIRFDWEEVQKWVLEHEDIMKEG
jgi:phage terminase Nu1 subunit (DNA packaging protein)